MRSGPEAGEFSRIFVLKVTLQSIRLPLTVSYRKKTGRAGCTSCSHNNFVLPWSPRLCTSPKTTVVTNKQKGTFNNNNTNPQTCLCQYESVFMPAFQTGQMATDRECSPVGSDVISIVISRPKIQSRDQNQAS